MLSFHIDLHKVSKVFGEVTALRDFSGKIHAGDRICILGHNGAGKSTLLNLLSTLARPSSGDITFRLDQQEIKETNDIRSRISFLSHQSLLYPDLTALENLRFVARMTGQSTAEQDLLALLDQVGMAYAAHRLFRTFSRGMQQRVSLARALLAKPQMLLLDEPFSGLDHKGVAQLKSLFTNPTMSWVLVTHHFGLGYELANRFWILRKGRLRHELNREDVDFETYLALCRQAGDSP